MDFVDWCRTVLVQVDEAGRAAPRLRSMGVPEHVLAPALFGAARAARPDFQGSQERAALCDALAALEVTGLVTSRGLLRCWRVTRRAGRFLAGCTSLWQTICAIPLGSEQEALLRTVNRLSVREAAGYAWLTRVPHDTLLAELRWPDGMRLLQAVALDLEEPGFVAQRVTAESHFALQATYRGLVWETRRAWTVAQRTRAAARARTGKPGGAWTVGFWQPVV